MSQENVELVRRIYDAAARRDDATPFEFYAVDIVWDLTNTRRVVFPLWAIAVLALDFLVLFGLLTQSEEFFA